MKRSPSIKVLVAGVIAAACLATSAFGAAFAKFDGVAGESTDPNRMDWIDVLEVRHNIVGPEKNNSSRGGGSAGKAAFSDLSVAKSVDKSTPKLQEAICLGRVFPKVEIEFVDTGGTRPEPYYKIVLTDVVISSFSQSASGNDVPTESMSLNYTKVEWEYRYYDHAGQQQTVNGGWDLIANKKI